MKKLIIIIAMTIFTFVPLFSTFSQTKVKDSETIYILSDPYGNFEEKILVDWIRVKGKGKFEVKDPIKNLRDVRKVYGKGNVEVKDDFVLLKGESKDISDVYYRGNYVGKIPFSINIKYFLNGEETPVEKVKGQSGNLRIDISAKTDLKVNDETVPLLAMVTTSLDTEKVKNVKISGDAKPMIMGRKYQVNLTLILDPEDSGFIEFESESISLPEIIITVIPSYFSVDIPEPEIFDELEGGIDKLLSLVKAQKMIIDETRTNLESGLNKMDFSQFNELIKGIDMIAEGIKSEGDVLLMLSEKIDEQELSKLKNLPEGIDSIIVGLKSEKEGIDMIVSLMDAYTNITKNILELNNASQKLAENTQSPTTLSLLESLKKEEALIKILLEGGITPDGVKIPSFEETKENMEKLSKGMDEVIGSLNLIKQGLYGVNALVDGNIEMKKTLITLSEGGEINGVYTPGLKGFSLNLKKMGEGLKKGISSLSTDIKKRFMDLVNVLKVISNSGKIMGKDVPGLSVTISGMDKMKSGVEEGKKEFNKKKEKMERKKELVKKVESFIGKPEDAEGNVEFIIKIKYN